MARLTRAQLKLFGETGAASYFGKFGSKAAGSQVNTKDIATIQDLAAWSTGLQDACVTASDGSKAPFLEDMNSSLYVHSYQQRYTLQEGIPEWHTSMTYYKGSVVKRIQTGTANIYFYTSLIDNNVGNAFPTAYAVSDSNWAHCIGFESGDVNVELGKGIYVGPYVKLVGNRSGIIAYWTCYINGYNMFACANEAGADKYFSIEPGTRFNLSGGGYSAGTWMQATTSDFYLYTNAGLAMQINSSHAMTIGGGLIVGGAISSSGDMDIGAWTSTAGVFRTGDWRAAATACPFPNMVYSLTYGGVMKMYVTPTGNMYIDGSYLTYSPNIKKDMKIPSHKDPTARQYLSWALADATKPIKPKTKKFEIGKEGIEKEYGKDISKISIGIAYWAKEAEARISALEAKQK